jgi:PKD repeat protein
MTSQLSLIGKKHLWLYRAGWRWAPLAVVLAQGIVPVTAVAAVRYVDGTSQNPIPPYTNWATAAAVIQDAVDAASPGDEIVVTNGVYAQGGRAVFSGMTNRVAITKRLLLRSVNGPERTIIEGYQVPGSTNGPGAVRCVYLTNGASLSGFTVTKGATSLRGPDAVQNGGGIWCVSSNAIITNCVLIDNGASFSGGGVYRGTLNHCILRANATQNGGGAAGDGTPGSCVLNDCILSSNVAGGSGGGVYMGALNNCTLTKNLAQLGGGAADDTYWGNSVLHNCLLQGNLATGSGGGALLGALNNCTVIGNSARSGGGVAGIYGSDGWGWRILYAAALNNCIISFNTADYDENYMHSEFNYCCTLPMPTSGNGNLALDPQLATASHLSAGSPCRQAGSPLYAHGNDIDGESWGDPPSIGCDEYREANLTGPLEVTATSDLSLVAPGYRVHFQADITGLASDSSWNFGDGTTISNQPFASHAWAAPGDYTVVLSAFNRSNPLGVSTSLTVHIQADVHYVSADSQSPVRPYGSWATAATNIQDAVDAAVIPGALVLVTNGVYVLGSRSYGWSTTNRVVVDKPILVRSVNGAPFTTIKGYQVPGITNDVGAVRCVYLANGASLAGFTLTAGATPYSGGGIFCETPKETASDCVITGNSATYGGGACGGTLIRCSFHDNAADSGGGAANAMLSNCAIENNFANEGGGVVGGTLIACSLNHNTAGWTGGGAGNATLSNCTIENNWASEGGGVYASTLDLCTLRGNSADLGGGADFSTLRKCTVIENYASWSGGGAADSSASACTFARNSATRGGGLSGGTARASVITGNFVEADPEGNSGYGGGGAADCNLINCTVTGNFSKGGYGSGGGTAACTLFNCIVYFNTAAKGPNYDADTTLDHCCTAPLPPWGDGNISDDPKLASDSHLSAESPCRAAGSPDYTADTDIDGEQWMNPPAIGCDEIRPGDVTGALSASIAAAWTNVAVGFPINFSALISGRATRCEWDFGGGVRLSNQPYVSHTWAAPGDYLVVLKAYNDSYAAGVTATVLVRIAIQPIHYVSAASSQPVPPYASWATASKTIQEAIDAVSVPGALVLVTNGTYATGGRAAYGTLTNRVVVDKFITVASLNGPQTTVIQGFQVPGTTNGDSAIRCVYVTSGAALSGFRLTQGATRTAGHSDREQGGGGVCCEGRSAVVSNCVLTGNSAYRGGGAYGGTLYNCVFTKNAAYLGGGAHGSALTTCRLTGNLADGGGGAYGGALNNCRLTDNIGSYYGGGAMAGTLNNCTLTGNAAVYAGGGGAYSSALNNCTLTGNSAAHYGGGALESTLYNCIVYYNSATYDGANYQGGTLSYCCTTPLPWGAGNLANKPSFVNTNGWSDLRLQSNSPCINAGTNLTDVASTDLDGRPRIKGGRVDIGAYEYQGPGMNEYLAWLDGHGLPTDPSSDYMDPDQDHYSTWQEWLAGSDPVDATSAPPFILTQPASHVAVAGTGTTFTVGAIPVESGLSYQWRFNLTNDIPGATNTLLTLPSVHSSMAGIYRVQVSNRFGSILSSNAVLRVDHPPVADASATISPVISPNGSNAVVVLDASRSSDPDDDALKYFWLVNFSSQAATPFATGIVAIAVLPVGSQAIELQVGDGVAVTTTTINVEVITASTAVDRLQARVRQQVARAQPLTASLQAALAALNRGNRPAGLGELQAFQNKIRAQLSQSDAARARSLIADAQKIITALTEERGDLPKARIVAVDRRNIGGLRVRVSGVIQGRPCLVEASTDLRHWERIGVAAPDEAGNCEFIDSETPTPEQRFYRVQPANGK